MAKWPKVVRFEPSVKIRRQIADLQRLSKSIGDVNNKTLSLCGRDIQEAAKRGVGQAAPKRRAAGSPVVVEINGGLYVDATYESGAPRKAGRPVKSWAPNRFLYRDIVYFLDASTGTVVVGPYKAPWLNQLHEFGGKVVQVAFLAGKKAAERAYSIRRKTGRDWVGGDGRPVRGRVTWVRHGDSVPSGFAVSSTTRVASYPARPFIQGAAGVRKALAKASRWFKDTYYPKPLR